MTSSGFAQMAVPYVNLYSAQKGFLSRFVNVISEELKQQIDVTAYEAGAVDTNMSDYDTKKYSVLGYLKPQDAAWAGLRHLG